MVSEADQEQQRGAVSCSRGSGAGEPVGAGVCGRRRILWVADFASGAQPDGGSTDSAKLSASHEQTAALLSYLRERRWH